MRVTPEVGGTNEYAAPDPGLPALPAPPPPPHPTTVTATIPTAIRARPCCTFFPFLSPEFALIITDRPPLPHARRRRPGGVTPGPLTDSGRDPTLLISHEFRSRHAADVNSYHTRPLELAARSN